MRVGTMEEVEVVAEEEEVRMEGEGEGLARWMRGQNQQHR